MTSLIYVCKYDGNECDEVIPKVDDNAIVKIENWKEICAKCERNCSLGKCYGILKIKEN